MQSRLLADYSTAKPGNWAGRRAGNRAGKLQNAGVSLAILDPSKSAQRFRSRHQGGEQLKKTQPCGSFALLSAVAVHARFMLRIRRAHLAHTYS